MSILSKALVVLVTLAACVCMALMVSFAANVDYSDQKLKDAQADASAAASRASFSENQLALLRTELSTTEASHLSAIAGLEANLSDARATISDRDRTIIDLRSQLEKVEAQNERFEAASADYAQIIEVKDTELGDLREQAVTAKQQVVELEDKNDELTAEVNMLRRSDKRSSEKVVTLTEDLQRAEAQIEQLIERIGPGLPTQPGSTGGTSGTDRDVYGSVVAVNSVGDETFVQINVGSSDTVRESHVFLLHRDGAYLGTLVIDTVESNAAVGRLRNKQGEATIQAGDKAYSGPNVS